MSIQEIWKIKEDLSEKFWGKSAEEINDLIQPKVEEMKQKIDELRKKREEENNNTEN